MILFCEAVSDVRQQEATEQNKICPKTIRDGQKQFFQLITSAYVVQKKRIESIIFLKNNMNSNVFFHTSTHFLSAIIYFPFFYHFGRKGSAIFHPNITQKSQYFISSQ